LQANLPVDGDEFKDSDQMLQHYKKKAIWRPIFSYQMKWLLIVTKIVTKLDFGY